MTWLTRLDKIWNQKVYWEKSEDIFYRNVDINRFGNILDFVWFSVKLFYMLKGTYTFPDLTRIKVWFNPKLSDADSVYVEWYSDSKVKQIMWLPSKGLMYTL